MTKSDYNRTYRERLKADPVRWASYLETERRRAQRRFANQPGKRAASQAAYRERVKSDPERLERYRASQLRQRRRYVATHREALSAKWHRYYEDNKAKVLARMQWRAAIDRSLPLMLWGVRT